MHHDRTLNRSTSLTGPVAARTAAELNRAAVPLLDDVLRRHRDARVIIELKVNHPTLARAAVEAVRALPTRAERMSASGRSASRVFRARSVNSNLPAATQRRS